MRKTKRYFDWLEQSEASEALVRFKNFLSKQGCRSRLHHVMGTYFNDHDIERKVR